MFENPLGGFSSRRARGSLSVALVSTFVVASSAGAADALSPQQQLAFDIYKELVEINTVTATGDTARCGRGDGGATARRRLSGRRRSRVLAGAAQGQSGRAAARHRRAQADPAAGASRRRAGQPRGLVGRSVQADREGRLFLCARQRRRQVHGGGLCHQSDPLQAGRLQARSRHHRRARDRRGDSRPRRARNPVAAQEPPRPDRCRIRTERGRRRRTEGRQADPEQRPDQRESLAELSARREKQGRPQLGPESRTMRSIIWRRDWCASPNSAFR